MDASNEVDNSIHLFAIVNYIEAKGPGCGQWRLVGWRKIAIALIDPGQNV
jgi:hypothetical protein